MNDNRRLCHSYCQRPDIRDPFIEGPTGLGIPDGLVKQVSEIVEQCVLFFDVKGEDAVEETRNVILIFLADFLNSIPNDKQSDVPQGLFRVLQTVNTLTGNDP